jgi:hypothetical protein
MSEKHMNTLPDQVKYRPLRERHFPVNEVMLRKSIQASSWEKPEEAQLLKEEVTDIIIKSVHLIHQLKQKA